MILLCRCLASGRSPVRQHEVLQNDVSFGRPGDVLQPLRAQRSREAFALEGQDVDDGRNT